MRMMCRDAIELCFVRLLLKSNGFARSREHYMQQGQPGV